MECIPKILSKRFKWWYESLITADGAVKEIWVGFYLFIFRYKIKGKILIEVIL